MLDKHTTSFPLPSTCERDQGVQHLVTSRRATPFLRIGRVAHIEVTGMADGRIGIGPSPGQDGSTVDNQIACANQSTPDGGQHAQHKERLWERAPVMEACFHCWDALGIRGRPVRSSGKPQARASAGQATNQSCISW
jgi:hypothetical protein